jgi:hypothetical protein
MPIEHTKSFEEEILKALTGEEEKDEDEEEKDDEEEDGR